MSPHPLICTRRSHGGQLFDAALTVSGWLFFIYLFVSWLLSERYGVSAPSASGQVTSTAHTLLVYAVLALANAATLIGWAAYNRYRFSSKRRRQRTRVLPEQHLCESFSLSRSEFDLARNARGMVIAHEQDSTICGIDIIRDAPARKPIPLQALVPEPQSLTSANDTDGHIVRPAREISLERPRTWRWRTRPVELHNDDILHVIAPLAHPAR